MADNDNSKPVDTTLPEKELTEYKSSTKTELAPTVAEEKYNIISLKFAVYESGKIAVLEKKEESKDQTAPLPDAVVVYDGKAKVEGSILNAIAKLNGTSVVGEEWNVEDDAEEKGDTGKNLMPETQGEGEGNGKDATREPPVGGSRKAQPKNVSFSRKYPKNKSNKKTLRNLERIVSH